MVDADAVAPPRKTAAHTERFAPGGWLGGVCASAIYLVASLVIFGGSNLAHLGTEYIPRQDASDSEFFRWMLAWTPWAVTHGQNPLFTHVLRAPEGSSLVWTTAVPGPALAMWPVTAAFGPLVSYNVLVLLCPVLAGWAAYLLCRRLSDRFWPSVAGGATFGFSAYMAIQLNHPNLALAFPIPLLVYFVVRRLEGSLGRPTFVVLAAITLLALWSISIELFATTTLFGSLAYLIALIAAGPDRRRLAGVLPWLGLAFAITIAVVFIPYLLPAIRQAPGTFSIDLEKKHNDLLRFVLPRDRQLVGGGWLESFSARLADPTASGVGFIGVGMIAAVIGYAITERRRRETWPIVIFVIAAAILALGPRLYVANHRTIPMPESIVARLPLVKYALPGRFMIFATLALGVIVALWLSRATGRAASIRWAVVGVGLLLMIPHVESPPWHVPDVTPGFFTDGSWSSALSPGETVAIMAEKKGQDMAWQADTKMGFVLPDGYLGAIPTSDSQFSNGLYPRDVPPPTNALGAWLSQHGVTAVVVMDPVRSWFEPSLRDLGYVPTSEADGVSVWRPA
ncbi:MAG TPA: hypothetical protein VHW68_03305 [Actinomycetota bacterium]|nr:hypothetical protein [Actinomycetota bacterium]